MNGPRRQRGFSLFVAIFLITSILVVAVITASTVTSRSVTTAQGFLAARVFYAARGGLEYAASLAVPAGQGCATVGGSLIVEGYSVALGCNETVINQGGTLSVMYQLTATSSSGNLDQGTFVSRTVRATVRGEP